MKRICCLRLVERRNEECSEKQALRDLSKVWYCNMLERYIGFVGYLYPQSLVKRYGSHQASYVKTEKF